jgi:hypothetical protein
VELLLDFIGGEEYLPHYVPEVAHDLLKLHRDVFCTELLNIRVLPSFFVADHHAMSIMSAKPAGSSQNRDCLGNTLQINWSKLHNENTTALRVSDLGESYTRRQALMEACKERWEMDSSGDKSTWLQVEKSILNFTNLTIGRVMSCPRWHCEHKSDLDQQLSLFNIPPAMHNVYHIHRLSMDVFLPLVSPNTNRLGEFYADFRGLEGLTSAGEICVSFARARRLTALAADILEPDVLAHNNIGLRVFAFIMRFSALISRHVYSPQPNTAKRRLRFRLLTFFNWLLVNVLSTFLGGQVSASGFSKNHVSCLYFKDLVEHMPACEEMFRLPWPLLSEEQMEQDFGPHKRYSRMVQKKTNLLGERIYREKERACNNITGK